MEKTTIRSLLDFQFVSDPGFSPRGDLAAFILRKTREEGKRDTAGLFLLERERKGGKRISVLGQRA